MSVSCDMQTQADSEETMVYKTEAICRQCHIEQYYIHSLSVLCKKKQTEIIKLEEQMT